MCIRVCQSLAILIFVFSVNIHAIPEKNVHDTLRGFQNSSDEKQLWEAPDETEKLTAQFITRLRKEAAANDAKAQATLGLCYNVGRGVNRDLSKAAEWYQKAAANGHAGAQNNLALLYDAGSGVQQDFKKAHQLYLRAANQGLSQAQFNLARNYAEGVGVSQDWAEAVNWYRKAAHQGHFAAMHNLANIYRVGRGTPVDLEEAKRLYRIPAEAGLAAAQFGLGAALLDQGKVEAANSWFRRSAEGGDPMGQMFWAIALYEGKTAKPDLREALNWALKSAHSGFAAGQALTAAIMLDERAKAFAVPNETKRWAQKAAEQGNAQGQHLLGICYHRGIGVERDLATAASWYQRAAEQKYLDAVVTLATLLESGKAGQQSYKDAAKWYQVAAEAGNALAQYRLALFYRDGTGVQTDLAEAERLLRLSAIQTGDSTVKSALADVERRRSSETVDAAEREFRRGIELAQKAEKSPDSSDGYRDAAEHLRKAADLGHASAQATLAGLYRRGQGVPKDDAEAEKLTARAENTSDPICLHLLGMSFLQNHDRIPIEEVPRAIEFFRRAAMQGYHPAQNSLGYALMSGGGVDFDFVEAFKWLTLAAKQGNRDAQINLDRVRPMLKASELEEGQRRAAEFKPTSEAHGRN